MPLTNRLAAEFIGTLWLVLGGCGSLCWPPLFPVAIPPILSHRFRRCVAGFWLDRTDYGLCHRPHFRLPI